MTSKQLQTMTKYDMLWNMKYEQLVEFKREKGYCTVPRRYEQDKSLKSLLGTWVSRQRDANKNNKLRPDRKRILDEIGFAWTVHGAHRNYDDKLWHQQHEKLVKFQRTHGHCMVPRTYEKDKCLLGRWVDRQRTLHKNNKMRPDREDLLDKIGFAWKDDGWHRQYQQLVKFKQKKGHCMVPHVFEQDKSLGKWVNTQRYYHKHNKLRQGRKERLDAIGFVWKVVTGPARSSSTTDVTGSDPQQEVVQEEATPESSAEEDGGDRDASSTTDATGSDQHQEVVQEEATPESYVEEDGGDREKEEEDSKPHLVTSSARIAARTNQKGKATGICSSLEEDGGGCDEEDSKLPSLVTSSARIGSYPDQEVVQEEATTRREIPLGWIRVKLEPDC
jgi:hypothetical protein